MDVPPENVVEPLARCLEFITRVREAADARAVEKQAKADERYRRMLAENERRVAGERARNGWIVFGFGLLFFFGFIAFLAYRLSGASDS